MPWWQSDRKSSLMTLTPVLPVISQTFGWSPHRCSLLEGTWSPCAHLAPSCGLTPGASHAKHLSVLRHPSLGSGNPFPLNFFLPDSLLLFCFLCWFLLVFLLVSAGLWPKSSPYEQPGWSDLVPVPWGLVSAIWWWAHRPVFSPEFQVNISSHLLDISNRTKDGHPMSPGTLTLPVVFPCQQDATSSCRLLT